MSGRRTGSGAKYLMNCILFRVRMPRVMWVSNNWQREFEGREIG